MTFSFAFGTVTENDDDKMALSSEYQSQNIDSVDQLETGITEINFVEDGDNEFSDDPVVILTPIATSEKQVRVDHDKTKEDDRKEKCFVDTYDQDGDHNDGLRNIDYGVFAVSSTAFIGASAGLWISTCLIDGSGSNNSMIVGYGIESSGYQRISTGVYRITFDQPYTKPPTVVATLARYSADEDDRSKYRSVVVSDVTTQSATVSVFDDDGDPNNEWFSFLAIGYINGNGNCATFKITAGYIDRDGDVFYSYGLNGAEKVDDTKATYHLAWQESNPKVVLATAEHDDEENVRQQQVAKLAPTTVGGVQIAAPPSYNDSRFHFIAISG